MIIAIIILSILLIFALAAIGIMYLAINILIEQFFNQQSPEEMAKEYFTKYGKESYDCTLVLTFQEYMGYDGSIFDFSRYEDSDIIMMVECYKEKAKRNMYYDEDGDPEVICIPGQKVWLMQDGSYQWDITPHL